MAKKRPGPYVGISANYADDEKIMEAGEDAELLYIRMLAYAARTPLTEGWISDAVLRSRLGIVERDAYDNSGNVTGKVPGSGPLERAETLLNVGLIERDNGGWRVCSWLRWNRSVEEMGKERRQDRDRKAALTSSSAEKAPETLPEKAPETPPVPTSNDQDQDQDHCAGSAQTKKKKRETPFPDTFTISDTHRAKAEKHNLDVEWQRTKFENHHRSKDTRFRDWSQAFHTWLNRAIEFQGDQAPPPAKPKRSVFDMTAEDWERYEQEMERRYEQSAGG